ncbi:MAG: Fe-S cluster assembly protein SufD [Acidimicrobiales bacterium mtb01]|nr:Fe-S cluster assembly protein SufD [Actinomycetota bacterium]TEX47367.1 MAG: Fe-S cluster assembly protein SufD [Acidimicrobiales bacterium mtb01]
MPVLTPDMVRSTGNSWSDVRSSALARASAAPFPTTDLEHWRYSRIDELDLARFVPTDTPSTITGGGSDAVVTHVPASAATADASLARLFPAADELELFAALNLAHMDVIVVSVPANKVVAEPIVVTHRLAGAGQAFFPRLIVEAGRNSEVTVVERFVSADDDVLLAVPALDVRADQAARVRYLGINELGTSSWLIGEQLSTGQRDSDTLLATVALGGDYARVSTAARLTGQGGNTRQVALYFAGGEQMHDFRTLQEHVSPRTTSDLLFKGAVQDTAKSVYTGLIKIHKDAKGSAAFQTNRNLTLSHGAWAESVPNLDIETNDVKCSHASTVGPIDEDQLFYLESRGVRPDVAQRLVVLGFFDEVLAQLPVGELATSLRAQVSRKLAIGDAS